MPAKWERKHLSYFFLKKQKLFDFLKNFCYNIYKKIQKVFSTIEEKEVSTLTIKEMLKSGKSVNDLYKEISDAQREIDAEKRKAAEQEKKEKAVAAAREKVVQAMKEYSRILYGVEPDVKLMDNFNSDLAEIEKASKFVTVSDDERIKKFLRGIML